VDTTSCKVSRGAVGTSRRQWQLAVMQTITLGPSISELAAEFPGWHIWRGRSASGRETGWHATGRPSGGRRPARLAATDAEALRGLLAQHEALKETAA
jgi:hypothetical protein